MGIYSQGISLKPQGIKVYSAGASVYSGAVGAISDGTMVVNEVADTLTLPGGGFNDLNYNGGQHMYSANGEGDWICCLGFSGNGVMGGSTTRASLLTQSIGEGFSTLDWVISGGTRRIAVFNYHYAGGTQYPLNADGINAVKNGIAWMQSYYGVAKVYLLESSQGGNILRWLCGNWNPALTSPVYVRANIAGAYLAAAEFPNTNVDNTGLPDLTGVKVYGVMGDNDLAIPYSAQPARVSGINAASSDTPCEFDVIPGGGHAPYWDDPWHTGRDYTVGVNGYDGFRTKLEEWIA